MDSSPNKQRVFGLDLLRAVAILLVLVEHSDRILPPSASYGRLLGGAGYWGVDLFFVLSGFLVGTLALKALEHTPVTLDTVWQFWRRRWYRTLPLYYFFLAVNIGLLWIQGRSSETNPVAYAVFGQSLAWAHPWFFGEAWSLAVEEWFYLLLPGILLVSAALCKTWRSGVAVALVAVLVGGLAFRVCWAILHPESTIDVWWNLFRVPVVVRLDAIMMGVVGAFLARYHASYWEAAPRISAVAGVVLILFCELWVRDIIRTGQAGFLAKTLYHDISSLGLLLLLPWALTLAASRPWVVRPITAIAIWSYALYLAHDAFLLDGLIRRAPYWVPSPFTLEQALVVYLGYWVACFVIAAAVYRWYEKPMMDLRDRKPLRVFH